MNNIISEIDSRVNNPEMNYEQEKQRIVKGSFHLKNKENEIEKEDNNTLNKEVNFNNNIESDDNNKKNCC